MFGTSKTSLSGIEDSPDPTVALPMCVIGKYHHFQPLHHHSRYKELRNEDYLHFQSCGLWHQCQDAKQSLEYHLISLLQNFEVGCQQ